MGTVSGPPMRRGDIVVIADRDGGDYSGKPRPAVVVQSDVFAETGSIVVEKLVSVRRERIGQHLGRLADDELVALNRSLAVFLGFA